MRPRGLPGRRGFTLVEVLIAIIILAVVTAILFVAFRTVNQVRDRQGELTRTDEAAVSALQQLSHDLISMVKDPSEAEGFVAHASDRGRGETAELRFTTLQPLPQETDMRWVELERVEYKVQHHPYPTPTLVRSSRKLTGPDAQGPVVTNALVRNVDYFLVELFDGKSWQSAWDTRQKKEWPQAAALKLRLVEGTRREHATRIFLPLGNPTATSFVRGTPAGPGEAPVIPSGNPPQ